MTSVGEIWSALRIDGSKAKADAAKVGAGAGDAASAAMGARIKKGAVVIGAALSAGLSVALVGRFAALERATANFRKETGATADEAARASRAINDMAGHNLQSVEEIGAVLTKVHTDLGLTGAEAERVTQQFLTYAQATGQNATDATLAFDDVLDAWGLTAKDAQGIMDALIVSHQRYGGSIADNQKLLADLAPALKAANLNWEDANGLLNLFARSGVQAEAATTAFNHAVAKVKSPEQLKSMLADIGSTTDSFERAQKSVALFGARAGPKLANALADSGGDLGAFTVKVDEAKGATDKAADASLTLADRIKEAFSGIVSTATDVLGPAGPLLTAIGGLAPLLGPVLSKAWKAVVGDFGLKAAIGAAGSAAGAIYSGAEAVVSAFISGIAAVWGKVAASPVVNAAIAAAGSAAGAVYAGASAGATAGAGFLSGFLAKLSAANIPLLLAPLLVGQGGQEQFSGTSPQVTETLKVMADDQLKQYIEFTKQHGDEASLAVAEAIWNQRVLDRAGQNAVAITTTWGVAVGKAAMDGATEGVAANGDHFVVVAGEQGTDAGRSMTKAVVDSGLALKIAARQAWQDSLDAAKATIQRGIRGLVDAFALAPVNMKDAIKNGKAAILEQFRDLAWQSKHPFAQENYADWLKGRFDDAMAKAKKAAKEGRPDLEAQYKGLANNIKTELDSLPVTAADVQRRTIAAMRLIKGDLATVITSVSAVGDRIATAFGAGFPGRASGGPEPVGPYWVGEHGPELHWGDGRGYITSAAQSATVATAAAGSQRLDVHIHAEGDGMARAGIGVADLGRWVTDALRSASDSAHIGSLQPRGL